MKEEETSCMRRIIQGSTIFRSFCVEVSNSGDVVSALHMKSSLIAFVQNEQMNTFCANY